MRAITLGDTLGIAGGKSAIEATISGTAGVSEGEVQLKWLGPDWQTPPYSPGWSLFVLEGVYPYGTFYGRLGRDEVLICFPMWLPASLTSLLLLLVWRKSRPKYRGKGFPVEVDPKATKTRLSPPPP